MIKAIQSLTELVSSTNPQDQRDPDTIAQELLETKLEGLEDQIRASTLSQAREAVRALQPIIEESWELGYETRLISAQELATARKLWALASLIEEIIFSHKAIDEI